MAKWAGKIGYMHTEETAPGAFTEVKTERPYYGEVIANSRRFENSQSIIDDIAINNRLSVVMDPYAIQNFQYIRYVSWRGSLWKVSSVTVEYPRLELTLGGVYNVQEN